ncbi:MAG: helix-turn-helix transcriptional regulator [Cryomorphaceae bacterium]|nr:helix-turn-helix transcriptional regulator [Cryomorphaceae bacterium]
MKDTNTLYIKNMVCQRCVMAVESVLQKHHIPYNRIDLGWVELSMQISDIQKQSFFDDLNAIGFYEVKSVELQLVEKIRNHIIQAIQNEDLSEMKETWSERLVANFHKDYSTLSKAFSQNQGYTIEHFVIIQKMERIKALLLYGELTIAEIAFTTGYSSSQFLATQFKQHTGMTPSEFRKNHKGNRREIDEI